jgi:hypothetical protein
MMLVHEHDLLGNVDWRAIYDDICIPSLQHTNADVRSSGSELVIAFYDRAGTEVKKEVMALRNVK